MFLNRSSVQTFWKSLCCLLITFELPLVREDCLIGVCALGLHLWYGNLFRFIYSLVPHSQQHDWRWNVRKQYTIAQLLQTSLYPWVNKCRRTLPKIYWGLNSCTDFHGQNSNQSIIWRSWGYLGDIFALTALKWLSIWFESDFCGSCACASLHYWLLLFCPLISHIFCRTFSLHNPATSFSSEVAAWWLQTFPCGLFKTWVAWLQYFAWQPTIYSFTFLLFLYRFWVERCTPPITS